MQKPPIFILLALILTSCGSSPSPSGPGPGVTTLEGTIQSSGLPEDFHFEAPPSLISGTFSALTTEPINTAFFPGEVGEGVSVIGILGFGGLMHIYLTDGHSIFYAVSTNGVDWALSPDPIFSGLINDDFEFFPSSVGFTDQGFAIVLSSATINYAAHNYLYSIWILSAPDPSGPWSLSETPQLYGYPNSNLYALYIKEGILRPFLDGYRMYHAVSFSIEGIDTPEYAVAYSLDGVSWRYTRELPSDESLDEMILLTLSNEVDVPGWNILDIWPTETGWQMLYTLPESEDGIPRMLLADSGDGIEWSPSNLDFEVEHLDPDHVIQTASVLFHAGSYYMAYCSTETGGHSYACFISRNQ